MDLSNMQKSYLQSLPFLDDDPNLSFPGFREDLNNKLQVRGCDMLGCAHKVHLGCHKQIRHCLQSCREDLNSKLQVQGCDVGL